MAVCPTHCDATTFSRRFILPCLVVDTAPPISHLSKFEELQTYHRNNDVGDRKSGVVDDRARKKLWRVIRSKIEEVIGEKNKQKRMKNVMTWYVMILVPSV